MRLVTEVAPTGTTYVLVDGENIDATLGLQVLKRRPHPDERPRWDRVRDFAAREWGQPVKALFFLDASNGSMPMSFIQALTAMDFRPIPLSGAADEKVVDIGIQRTLDAIGERTGDVLLASHDGDFLPQMMRLAQAGRRTGLLAFREYVSSSMLEIKAEGLQIYDLEDEVKAFTGVLPRVRVISLEDFDPVNFL